MAFFRNACRFVAQYPRPDSGCFHLFETVLQFQVFSGSGKSISAETVGRLFGTPGEASPSDRRHQIEPRVSFEILRLARSFDHCQARDLDRMALEGVSALLVLEVQTTRAATATDRSPEFDSGDG